MVQQNSTTIFITGLNCEKIKARALFILNAKVQSLNILHSYTCCVGIANVNN